MIRERTRTQNIATCALMCALLVVSAWFTIPIGSIPVTLQTMVVILIALLLEPKWGFITIVIYLLMGTVGLPVFSGITGGIVRTSTGFLLAYLVSVPLASLVRGALVKTGEEGRARRLVADILVVVICIVIPDILGWLWLMFYADMAAWAAFLAADAPFILIDCCKGVVAIIIAKGIKAGLHWK